MRERASAPKIRLVDSNRCAQWGPIVSGFISDISSFVVNVSRSIMTTAMLIVEVAASVKMVRSALSARGPMVLGLRPGRVEAHHARARLSLSDRSG